MKIIKKWRNERRFTFQFMSELLGVSENHLSRIYRGESGMSAELEEKAGEIERLLHLIDGEPNDILLLKYELQTITGVSAEDYDNRKTVSGNRLSETQKDAFKLNSDLSMFTLKTLHRIRENGYKSLSRPDFSYYAEDIDSEIEIKEIRKAQAHKRKVILGGPEAHKALRGMA